MLLVHRHDNQNKLLNLNHMSNVSIDSMCIYMKLHIAKRESGNNTLSLAMYLCVCYSRWLSAQRLFYILLLVYLCTDIGWWC